MKFISKIGLIIATSWILTACGNGALVALPDDPQNEPAQSEGQGEEGSAELPSELPSEVPPEPPPVSLTEEEQILKLYDYLDPSYVVPTKALKEAVLYYHKNKSKFPNSNLISIIDYSQKSTQKRWYFINLSTGVVWNIHVSHGKGSDSNHDGFAESFSNISGSNATSLGFYKTAETYQGSNGYSLRLDGLSSTNSKARERAIVVHGASYVQDSNVIQGRSWGCPAVSTVNRDKVINMLKGGSLLYATR